jgi:class 3 adenylate cyclase
MDKIEELLKTRSQVDLELEKLKTPVTVLFTDIRGSTSFFESEGDVEGLAMVQRHNDLLFPIIGQHSGRVVKTIGDAIMAMFDNPENCIRAAISMQQALARYNEDRGRNQEIHIRIGLHHGLGLIKNGDVYGDVVNTASRVEHQSQPDQIFVSTSLLEAARTVGVESESAGTAELKGKAETVELYRLNWQAYVPKSVTAKPRKTKVPVLAVFAIVVIIGGAVLFGLRPATESTSPDPTPPSVIQTAQGVSAAELCDLLLANPHVRATLESATKPVSQDGLLAAGFRGLNGEAQQIITRAEFALLLEDLTVLSTGATDLPTKFIGAESSPFTDVAPTHPAFNAIMNAIGSGLMQARGSGTFAPADPLTRSEIESALNRF